MTITPNALFHADCLAVLERMQEGQVTLAYLDPPWNTSPDFSPVDEDSTQSGTLRSDYTLLSHVTQQCHRILSNSGSVYWFTVPALVSTVRLILDQVFGRHNFRGDFILPTIHLGVTKGPPSNHYSILLYSKSDEYHFEAPTRVPTETELHAASRYEDSRGPFFLRPLITRARSPSNSFQWRGHTLPSNRQWLYSRDRLEKLLDRNLVHFPEQGFPKLKVYLEEASVPAGSIWDDISPIRRIGDPHYEYAGQQPVALLERIVRMGSAEGNIVFDPFCGSGTALVAAQKNGRPWIACDVSEEACQLTMRRLEETSDVEVKQYFQGQELASWPIVSDQYSTLVTGFENSLPNLLSEGENQQMEFKEAVCWNKYRKQRDGKITESVLKDIAGFMNTPTGGTIIIGVSDTGEPIGLQKDYQATNPQKHNRDGYELFLNDKLRNAFDVNVRLCTIEFQSYQGKEICQITIIPANEPVFYEGEFYWRNGRQTVPLTPEETYRQIQERWPSIWAET